MIDLSIIVVNFNTKDITIQCLKKVFDQKTDLKIDVVVVDNGSTDGSYQVLKTQFPKAKLIKSEENLGFTGGNNLGIKNTKAKYYFLLNSDAFIKSGSLDNMVSFAKEGDFGILGCEIENKDGSFQPSGGKIPNMFSVFGWLSGLDDLFGGVSYQAKNPKYFQSGDVGWVGGAAMLISDETLSKIGLLDQKIFMYGEDVEYCVRAKRNGIKVGWTDTLKVTHLGGASSNTPKLNQWRGEFKGLLYLYQKYYGNFQTLILKMMIYLFVFLRVVAFTILGKFRVAQTYGKIIFSI